MDSQGCPPNGWGSDDIGEGPSQPYNLTRSDVNPTYCASWNCLVAEPWHCIDLDHLVPGFNVEWNTDQPFEAFQAHDTTSPSATQSTIYSDINNTGSSYYSDLGMPVAGQHELDLATNPSTNTNWTGAMQSMNAACGNGGGLSIAQHPIPDVSRGLSGALEIGSSSGRFPADCEPSQIPLSCSQIDTLERFRQRWITEAHLPTDAEIESIATLEQLSPETVRAWFQAHSQASATSSTNATSGSSKGKQKLSPTQGKPSQTVAEVRQWARNKFWQACKLAQTQNSRTDLPFECTSGCTYSTDKIDAWRRHEMGWQPQHFWHCVCCRSNGASPFICARKDKFFDHLKAAHQIVDKKLQNSLRDSSEVTDAVGFERQCKFVDALGRPCPSTFQSWEERLQHYLAHFRRQISYGPWSLRYGRHQWFDDDGSDEQGGSSGSTSPDSPNAHDSSTFSSGDSRGSTGSSGHNQQRYGQHRHAVASPVDEQTRLRTAESVPSEDLRCRECSTQQRTRPTLLIHVPTARLVEPPLKAKYLALDHTWAAKTPTSRITSSATFHMAMSLPLTDDRLPIPLEQLRAFAHGIGYSYLWIAELCEPQSRSCVLRSIQERASLHMVSVRCPERPQSLLHFACRSSNVKEVQEWANQRGTISHVRNLGHGSYGIVDEVKINPGQQVLARKELSTSRLRNRQGNAKLQEVLIMQRLNHPHISHSKSAYYDHTLQSWNILMTPVADGTLRDYMAEPSRWPDRQKHIAKWYVCLAAALEYMHGAHCRHKDIKPANILLSGHNVLLSDFGTSHDFSAESDFAGESWTEGYALMTPRYAAPEVALEARRGTKADVFSLGCVYAEMLTTELGHTLEDMYYKCGMSGKRGATYARHVEQLRQWLHNLSSESISPQHLRIIAVCKSMISPDASDRPSAKDVLDNIVARDRNSTTPSHSQCWCLDRREPDACLPRPCLETTIPTTKQQYDSLPRRQRLRSGRGRRCRSRVVLPTPQSTSNEKGRPRQQLWFYRPVPTERAYKPASILSSLIICSFATTGSFLGMYLETQLAYSSMTISIMLSQGMGLGGGKTCDSKIYTEHDHGRFKKLYWKALCIIRVVVASHSGMETQLTDRKCVTRTHDELLMLPSMLKYIDPTALGLLIPLARAMASRFGSQTRMIVAAIACAQASFLPVVEMQRLLC